MNSIRLGGHSANSGVVVPLSDTALTLIGKPSTNTPSKELIFELPSYTACSKALKRWVKRAKIDKHITWHSGRHSKYSFQLKTSNLRNYFHQQVTT